MFPDTQESRQGSETEALPAIWTHWEDFTALASKFTKDSKALASVASDSSKDDPVRAVKAAFFRASKSCSRCHERFQLDQD